MENLSGRRAFVRRGAAATSAAWVAPAVFSTAPVAAATGSCAGGISVCEFTGGLEGWTIDNTFGPGVNGLWSHNTELSRDGGSLHYGRGTTGNYRTGTSRNSGAVTSMSFDIPSSGTNEVEFSVFRDVENWSNNNYDVLRLSILGTSSNQTVWSAGSDGGTAPNFVTITAAIPAAFDGDTVQFRFDFDTVDGLYNTFEGIYVGRFQVTACPTVSAGLSALSSLSARSLAGDDPGDFPAPNPSPRR